MRPDMKAVMKARIVLIAVFALTNLPLVSANAAAPAKAASKQTMNRVKFLEPINGAKVSPKFKVKMNVEGYTIGPLGDLTKGKGHHHIIVDGASIPEGQVVPTDNTHIHFGKGQTEAELELAPGKHKLTLQFADGAHRSYGPAMSETIEVEVTK